MVSCRLADGTGLTIARLIHAKPPRQHLEVLCEVPQSLSHGSMKRHRPSTSWQKGVCGFLPLSSISIHGTAGGCGTQLEVFGSCCMA